MSKLFLASVGILLVAYIGVSSALNCGGIVRKESEGVLNWLGNVTFIIPRTVTGWVFVMQFDQVYTGVGVWDATSTNYPDIGVVEFFNKTENGNLISGQEFSFRFRVNYPRFIPQPVVVSFQFQDIQLCI